jgi:hypothetical protein
MAVAKTYAKMEISGEPFMENKRMYVNVISPKGLKKVRWYSDAEYHRMYPEETVQNDIMDFNARHAFGFGDLGFIVLYKGNQQAIEDFAAEHPAGFRRNLTFGYYTPSHINIDLPDNIIPVRLDWTDVMDHDTRMKPHEEVKKIVASLLYDITASQYQGEINDWLQQVVTVKTKINKESHFGTKHTYNLVDSAGNIYVWETGAKDYACDTTISLKMKVKEHKEIDGNKVTVVWYCKEV